MPQHNFDPLLAIGVATRVPEAPASPDRQRFSNALEAAVEDRPAQRTAEASDGNAARQAETASSTRDQQRDEASDPTDRDEETPAPESADAASSESADEDQSTVTLTLTTEATQTDPALPLASTTIVAVPAEEGASLAVVETATPELQAELTLPITPGGQSPGDGLPTGESPSATPLPSDPTQDLTTEGQSGEGEEIRPEAIAGEDESTTRSIDASADDGGNAVVSTSTALPTDGQQGLSGQQTNPETGVATAAVDRQATGEGGADSETDQRQSARGDRSRTNEAIDQSGPRAQETEAALEIETDGAPDNPEELTVRRDPERSTPTQDAASSRPWSRIGATRALHPAAEAELTDLSAAIDRPRFVQRISGAIEAAERRGGPILVRLSPPELGSLKIELVMRHGTMAATLETETASARQVLLDNLPALRTRLAEQDIRVEQFDVDVRRDGREAPDGGPSDRRPSDESPNRRPTRASSPSEASDLDRSVRNDVLIGNDDDGENLDIRI